LFLNLSGVLLESGTSSSLAGHIHDQTVEHENPNRKLAVWTSSGRIIAIDGLLYDSAVDPLFLKDAEGIFINDIRDGDKVDILLRNHTFLLQNGYLQRNPTVTFPTSHQVTSRKLDPADQQEPAVSDIIVCAR
jgi:hypothetical protein